MPVGAALNHLPGQIPCPSAGNSLTLLRTIRRELGDGYSPTREGAFYKALAVM